MAEMKRIMYRNAALRAARNMKIVQTELPNGAGFKAHVAGQEQISTTAPTASEAVIKLKDTVLAQSKTNEGLSGFKQTFI